jgi:hypothetical protein
VITGSVTEPPCTKFTTFVSCTVSYNI